MHGSDYTIDLVRDPQTLLVRLSHEIRIATSCAASLFLRNLLSLTIHKDLDTDLLTEYIRLRWDCTRLLSSTHMQVIQDKRVRLLRESCFY